MSTDESKVNIVADHGKKMQWATGLFYRKDGNKFTLESRKLKYIAIAFCSLTTTLLLFRDDPPSTTQVNVILEDENYNKKQSSLHIEEYKEDKPRKKSKKRKKRLPIQRLSLISRKNAGKIPLGSEVKAKLLTGGTNGPIKAKLTDDLVFNGEIFLRSDTLLIGSGSSTDERLIISFTKAVLEDGTARDISAYAHDISDKILGLKGSKVGRTTKKFLAKTGLHFLSGISEVLQERENIGGIPVRKATAKNAFLNGTGQAAMEESEDLMEELKNKQTVIEVPKDAKLWVVFGGGS